MIEAVRFAQRRSPLLSLFLSCHGVLNLLLCLRSPRREHKQMESQRANPSFSGSSAAARDDKRFPLSETKLQKENQML